MVAKAEQLDGKENPRFVVTNLSAEQWPALRRLGLKGTEMARAQAVARIPRSPGVHTQLVLPLEHRAPASAYWSFRGMGT